MEQTVAGKTLILSKVLQGFKCSALSCTSPLDLVTQLQSRQFKKWHWFKIKKKTKKTRLCFLSPGGGLDCCSLRVLELEQVCSKMQSHSFEADCVLTFLQGNNFPPTIKKRDSRCCQAALLLFCVCVCVGGKLKASARGRILLTFWFQMKWDVAECKRTLLCWSGRSGAKKEK